MFFILHHHRKRGFLKGESAEEESCLGSPMVAKRNDDSTLVKCSIQAAAANDSRRPSMTLSELFWGSFKTLPNGETDVDE